MPSSRPHSIIHRVMDKKTEVILFSSIAIALYGYDQGMMSLINTNYNYLATMGLAADSSMVGVIVSVYYLGCAVGAVLASWLADVKGRKTSIFACVTTAGLGNLLMFISGLGGAGRARDMMLAGRIIMGLGVGGIDSVVPVYSAELASDDARGIALAQEFQANILGLNMAFAFNVLLTKTLGKWSQWAWRLPIIIMQIFPVFLVAVITRLPETPRWFITHSRASSARKSLVSILGGDADEADTRLKEIQEAHEIEQREGNIKYRDMLIPGATHWHPTVIVIMGQINQALTGYGAVSVYGPQIFELLNFSVTIAEYITLGNYLFYLAMMTLAWLLIDRVGRRFLMVNGAWILTASFTLLTLLGGLAMNYQPLHIGPPLAIGIPGVVILYLATSAFGICWLVPPWLVPTEIFPSTARAQGAAISVIIWGLANFAVTFLTPIGFNNLHYWLFLVFAVTNLFAGWWTWMYTPESGGRSFEENQEFFKEAEGGGWSVFKVKKGEWLWLPKPKEDGDGQVDETQPLLQRGEEVARSGVDHLRMGEGPAI